MTTLAHDLLLNEPSLVFEIRQGIERECLRVDRSGMSALTSHPQGLGNKLTHKSITTDYSENLLEFITGVHKNNQGLFQELANLHAFTYQNIGDELLWPNSMPSILPSEEQIPIAYYGESHVGKLKTLYRKGLGHRYGKTMQSIAGLHYNFSLSDTFWKTLQQKENSSKDLKTFKNEKYFHLIRNFQKYRWILMYLFGASNVVHKSFLEGKKHKLEVLDDETFYSPEGVSLRMGGLGYTSHAQEKISICFNQVETYIKTLEAARLESFPAYEKIGLRQGDELLQLNTNLLQIDNEFYSTIRPKNIAKSKESALKALYLRGVEYIEVRLMDINPFAPMGITPEQSAFLNLFLLWCLSEESADLSAKDCQELESNFLRIVNKGRVSSLNLLNQGEEVDRDDWLKEIFQKIEKLATNLSKVDPFYAVAFDSVFRMYEQKNILSQKFLENLRGKSYRSYSLDQAQKFKQSFQLDENVSKELVNCREASIEQEVKMVEESRGDFGDFLTTYFEDIKIN